MSSERIVALTGLRDEPTDGVSDYCSWLGGALVEHGYDLSTFRVDWAEKGWRAAFADLRKKSAEWRDSWILLQFTTLAWSRRGFPIHASKILRDLRHNGIRCGVMFHDFAPLGGNRTLDRARSFCQLRILKQLYQQAECAIFPVPLEMISWLPEQHEKAVFIPVGANCPERPAQTMAHAGQEKIVSVYSVTGGPQTLVEAADIGSAVRKARITAGPVRLVVVGRGSQEADAALRREFAETDVKVETLGLMPAEELAETLAASDVLLFVRGQISSRRGSALAGIACGLPVVCYSGPETGWPVTEAGLISAPLRDREALSAALEHVLTDATLHQQLADRSRNAQEKYFSWRKIAEQYAIALKGAGEKITTPRPA